MLCFLRKGPSKTITKKCQCLAFKTASYLSRSYRLAEGFQLLELLLQSDAGDGHEATHPRLKLVESAPPRLGQALHLGTISVKPNRNPTLALA